MQAAIGLAQLQKLPEFVRQRQKNHEYLFNRLRNLSNEFILPTATTDSTPSWFGFLLVIKDKSSFTRNEIVTCLEQAGIQTRNLFAGNILHQPCVVDDPDFRFRIASELQRTDYILDNGFWIGVYPGMTLEMLDYMADSITNFVALKGRGH
jgi:CDP-6-deoxy-D-xylo-4-hexulose-3-dehydrase